MKNRAISAPQTQRALRKRPSAFIKVGAALATLGTTLAILPGANAADDYKPDGSSSHTAAASCWEIKQNNPEAPSGAYWLWTPQMSAPAQFYCDQENNGGGWVMIGRGRESWTESYLGRGKAAELHANPDGTDAFSPVQLPAATVDALLGGQKVSDLTGGVRVRRAANAEGTKWQEVTMTRPSAEGWSWTLSAIQNWNDIEFSGDSPLARTIPNTYATVLGQMMKPTPHEHHLYYYATASKQWKMGFSYGWDVSGQNNPTTHLWSPTGHNATPFSQMFVRPQITQAELNLTDYAASGVAGSNRLPLPNSYTAPVHWRTGEQTGTGITGEFNTYVQSITQVGDTVFTGGDFAFVENAQIGERVNQKFLAGYNVHTGELVRSFMPTFDGQIKSIAPMDGNRLVVGGEFTQVNGEDYPGLVILDATTGEIDRSFNFGLEQRISGLTVSVRSVQVHGDYIYVAGKFTHLMDTNTGRETYTKNAGRFIISKNTPDREWKPNFNWTVNGLSVSEDGSTISAAGYFSHVKNTSAWKLAYLNNTNGDQVMPWTWEPSHPLEERDGYQLAVEDAGATVWAAGAEHIVHNYSKANGLRRINSSITLSGGDFQDLHHHNGVIYAACHCGEYLYHGGKTWKSTWNNDTLRDVHTVRLTAAFDANTGEILPEFAPIMRGASGDGVWAQFVDSTGTLWVGGDINSSLGAYGVQKTVGFARFTQRYVNAPAVPGNLEVTSDGVNDQLTWSKVNGRNVSYQILRDNRVIATTTGTTLTLPAEKGARYFVRSVDHFDNYSATLPGVTAQVVAGEVAPAEADPAAQVVPAEEAPVEVLPEALQQEVVLEEQAAN